MRKIEQAMIQAIKTRRSYWKQGNTEIYTAVRPDNALIQSVYLHGNLIAQGRAGEYKSWGFKLCGWNSPTTRSRINALTTLFENGGNYYGVTTKKNTLYACHHTVEDLKGQSVAIDGSNWFWFDQIFLKTNKELQKPSP